MIVESISATIDLKACFPDSHSSFSFAYFFCSAFWALIASFMSLFSCEVSSTLLYSVLSIRQHGKHWFVKCLTRQTSRCRFFSSTIFAFPSFISRILSYIMKERFIAEVASIVKLELRSLFIVRLCYSARPALCFLLLCCRFAPLPAWALHRVKSNCPMALCTQSHPAHHHCPKISGKKLLKRHKLELLSYSYLREPKL